MKAAIYARYSTDLQDATSISGQQANCEKIIAANGLQIVKRYSDEAISGSDDNRPGYRELLADSEAGLFDVIVVDETSRLTRSAGELPRLIELLAFRNQFLVDCKGFDSRNETSALLASVYGGIDSLELRKIKERTHRGLRERAKAGYSTGGRVYGYDTVPIDPDDPDSKKRYTVNTSEAEVIVEIFQRYADGESTKAICDDLNRRGVPSPGSTWNRTKRRCRGWVHTALAGNARTFDGMLRREMYVGTLIWNRCQWKKVPGTSRRKREVRPESEWTVAEAPELRIIDADLWDRVQARLKTPRRKTAKPKRLPGRPPRYLLSGLLKCGECGANFIMQDARAYGCSSHTNGGRHLCDNDIRVKRETAEDALLANVKKQLLSDETIRYIQRAVTAALREQERQSGAGSIKALEQRQRDVHATMRSPISASARPCKIASPV
jgi:DNA invertase Pin-like site-specific DNA recombinase